MGGGTSIIKGGITYIPDEINFNKIDRSVFCSDVKDLLIAINNMFFMKNKSFLWNIKSIDNGNIFNGSSSWIFNCKTSTSFIKKYKPIMGDIDIMIPRDKAILFWEFMKRNEYKHFCNFTYIGNNRNKNKLGNTIICIFKYNNINIQFDFELCDFTKNLNPTQWDKFSHSSNKKDIIHGIKGFHHKFLIQSLIGVRSSTDKILICTPSTKLPKIRLKKVDPYSDIRLLKFSVFHGVSLAYEPILYNNKVITLDGKELHKELKTTERKYTKSITKIFEYSFGKKPQKEEGKKFNSFVGIVELISKLPNKDKLKIRESYLNKLWGNNQRIDSNDNIDFNVKWKGWDYFCDNVNIDFNNSFNESLNVDSKIKNYYKDK